MGPALVNDLAALVHKTVEFAYRGAKLKFDLSHALFSSFDVDTGTRLLLKEIAKDDSICSAKSILDAGCGTGIIGISMAASSPQAKLVLRDRDLLACAISERNAWRNGLPVKRLELGGAEAPRIAKKPPKHKKYREREAELVIAPGLLGEADPLGPYDAVLSNLPAKAGGEVLARFVRDDAPGLLKPGGRFAFVIVSTLLESAEAWILESGMSLVRKTVTKSHGVFILEKPAVAGLEASPGASVRIASEALGSSLKTPKELAVREALARAGIPESYLRSRDKRSLGAYTLPVLGIWGLPEFDTTSFATDLAITSLAKACAGSLVRDFLLLGPGLGLPALWARAALGCDRIHLVSRDSLALRAAAANLIAAFPHPGPETDCLCFFDSDRLEPASMDAALCFPDEIPEFDYVAHTWAVLASSLKTGGAAILVSTPTILSRFEKTRPAGMWKLGEMKKKGFSALLVRRTSQKF